MLVLISGIFGAVYSVGYSNPGHGMGLLGLPRDPLGALRITALVLGGPITDQSLWWGAACGFAGMLVLVPATLRLLRGGGTSWEETALTGICVFCVLYALAFAFARFTPESIAALGSTKMLGSHDFTVPLFFWGTLLALAGANSGILSKVSCVIPAALAGYMTLHSVPSQLACSMAWLEFHRTLDVAGAGMILEATDPDFLFELMPDQNSLDYYRPYMRQHHFSFFADDRAYWIDRNLNTVFRNTPGECGGSIDQRLPAGHTIFRIEGFVEGPSVKFPLKREIVLTDASGKIDGLGNTLVVSEKRGGQDFVAYADSAAAAAYVITPNGRACRFATQTQ